MSSKVFVGGLNFSTPEEEIQRVFSEVGQVQSVFLPVDRDTGRKRGFAFVEFSSESEAAAAIEKFNGYELDGRALRVNAAEEKPPRSGGFGAPRFSGGGQRPGGGGGGGDRNGGGGGGAGRPKGSRRNIRAKKRSL